jgi:uncharacterized RDD family membrane protein YckC
METSQVSPIYAGFWLRFVAAVIDALVLCMPFFFVTFVIIVISKLAASANESSAGAVVILLWPIVTVVAASFYFAVLESSPWQATIGKRALGLYVCDSERSRLTVNRAAGRMLAKYLSGLTIGVGFVICGFTKKKQALHDMIAGCLVLRRPR